MDARNVLRSQWPNIPEDELVALCREWARAHEYALVVVFDGRAPGGVIGERDLDEHCLLVGTGRDESADEWLVRAARSYAEEGRPYWLVTSDRALRAAAGQAAEKTIGGGTFARALTERR